MNSDKHLANIDYAHIVRALGLPIESGFHSFDTEEDASRNQQNAGLAVVLRDAMLLLVCRKGRMTLLVGGASHTLVAGQMLLLFAGTPCRFTHISPDFSCSVVVGRVNSEASTMSLVAIFPRVRQMPVVSLLKQENTTLTALMRYIQATAVNYRNPSRAEIDGHILSILRGELIDIFLRRNLAVKEATQDEQLVMRFSMMLAVNSFEHRDVEFYARECGLTAKRFAAKVKRITDKTPSDLIASAVIKNAKRLLISTDLNSTEIAEKLNFSTPSFFCRYFKRYTGLSPQEWKSQNSGF